MKRCSNCGAEKPPEDFQVRKASSDGRTASCKECLRERDRGRNKSEKRIEGRKAYAQGKGKDICNACKIRYIEKNPKKRSAHIIVGNALRDKKIFKSPCEICGGSNSQAHHDDYDKPLDVRWLCPVHHEQWHADNGPGLNGE